MRTCHQVALFSAACGALLAGSRAEALVINVAYNANVPAAAQTSFNTMKAQYETLYKNPVTVNLSVQFGATGLGGSSTNFIEMTYANWVADMKATSLLYPSNTYLNTAKGTLPLNDPIGNGTVQVRTANARAIGVTAAQVTGGSSAVNPATDSTLTFSNTASWAYTQVADNTKYDFMSTAAHELNEVLGIGSGLTGIANGGALPAKFEAEDFFRYNAAGARSITTSSSAAVYFTYDPTLATYPDRFNQDNNAGGNVTADRNDWIWGNFGGPSATVEVQNAVGYMGQPAPLIANSASNSEFIVLSTLGWSVPEPSSMGLLCVGLIACARRRKPAR